MRCQWLDECDTPASGGEFYCETHKEETVGEWYTGYVQGTSGFPCPDDSGHMFRQGWLVGSGTPSPGYNRSSVEHYGDSMQYDHLPKEIDECETGK